MYCPVCSSKATRVVDTRLASDTMIVRRRRECEKCHYRFSTKEVLELPDITVVKYDGGRESYNRDKLQQGILHSLVKRQYTKDKFDQLIFSIERDLRKKKRREVTSKEIGEIVMKHLRRFDKVAYIRFASIYRAFEDVDTFEKEVRALTRKKQG
ncbi:MAG: transcriptional repressor NrdR [Candidatus Magasanikbacteria bacterium]|nr:transcriptional repressor NrdR [Candidatus Magasanikbacteria bacterium]NCS99735.1 transcriptional repressor NrdR [Candidatus Parcubacteria bacterium]